MVSHVFLYDNITFRPMCVFIMTCITLPAYSYYRYVLLYTVLCCSVYNSCILHSMYVDGMKQDVQRYLHVARVVSPWDKNRYDIMD